MKIVINEEYGGFGLSREAAEWMAARGHEEAKAALEEHEGNLREDKSGLYAEGTRLFGACLLREVARNDPLLIECMETLGAKAASPRGAALVVVEVPDDGNWHVDEYDGAESINLRESHGVRLVGDTSNA